MRSRKRAYPGRYPAGAGRTIVLSSFLLGGPSGSGVATTVTLGSVAYPMLMKAGYGKDAAGGLLAAGGLGAIISPPVLGAAAFLIVLIFVQAIEDCCTGFGGTCVRFVYGCWTVVGRFLYCFERY